MALRGKRRLILVSGYYGFGNLGDEAILEELLCELTRLVPASDVVVLSAHPNLINKLYGVQTANRWDLNEFVGLVLKTRVFISGGGGLFQDVRGTRSTIYYGLLIFLARILGANVFVYAQGIGPLSTRIGRSITRMAMACSNVISVRDIASFKLLRQWQIPCTLTADPVWCLEHRESIPVKSSVFDAVLDKTIEAGLTVGLSLRESTNFNSAHGSLLLKVLIETLPPTARLVCLSFQDDQDKVLLQKFKKEWENIGRNALIISASEIPYPSQWLDVLKKMDLVIAMRFHALVMALKSAVPVVGIAYDPKVSQLMAEFGQPMLNLPNDLSQWHSTSTRTLKFALNNMPYLSKRSLEKSRAAKKMACRNFDLLAGILTLSDTHKPRHEVLGYPVDLMDESTALKTISCTWDKNKGTHIITLNAEMVVAAQKDKKLDGIIRQAGLIIPDGAGVVFALRLSGQKINRLPGIELASAALNLAAQDGLPVALLGGRQEIVTRLLTVLPRSHPGLNIVGSHHGYYSSHEERSIVESLAAVKPKLLLVALGVPRQEYFVERWQAVFPQAVIIGVGGSFDVWAGVTKRAPAVLRKLHMEWFYRLLSEPWRFRRMSMSLPYFGFKVLAEYIDTAFCSRLRRVLRRCTSPQANELIDSKDIPEDK